MLDGELRDYVGHRVKGNGFNGKITGLKYDDNLQDMVFIVTQGKEVSYLPTRSSELRARGLQIF